MRGHVLSTGYREPSTATAGTLIDRCALASRRDGLFLHVDCLHPAEQLLSRHVRRREKYFVRSPGRAGRLRGLLPMAKRKNDDELLLLLLLLLWPKKTDATSTTLKPGGGKFGGGGASADVPMPSTGT